MYKIIKKLVKGSYGTVYIVSKNDNRYAMKNLYIPKYVYTKICM